MKSSKIFRLKSKNNNDYLLSPVIPQMLLLHPVLNYILKKYEEGIELYAWYDSLCEDKVSIEENLIIDKGELCYYLELVQLLENNGYLRQPRKIKMSNNCFTANHIKSLFASTEQILFETTELCNLSCSYCGYGDMYTNLQDRGRNILKVEWAKRFLDYFLEIHSSGADRAMHKKLFISFYGGEPLLNMPFIEEIVSYISAKETLKNKFMFSIATNGTLLDKHMDFLVENDFILAISLDGNKANNSYRKFKDGRLSHDIVYQNCIKLKEKYPDYFRKKAYFVSVIHNNNSYGDVKKYFNDNFETTPIMIEISDNGIKEEKREEFLRMFRKKYQGFPVSEFTNTYPKVEKTEENPIIINLSKFIRSNSMGVFPEYDKLLDNKEKIWRTNTGTCYPFQKKIFLTARGRILPCERINQDFFLGIVDEEGVHLGFADVAEKYNEYNGLMMSKCNNCFHSNDCPVCIFTLDLSKENVTCEAFQNIDDYMEELSVGLTTLEQFPKYYSAILKNFNMY